MNTSRQKKRPFFDPFKYLEWMASLLFAAIVAVLIAGFFPLSYPLFNRYVHSITSKSPLGTCTVGKIKVALWKGITLYDVHACKSAEDGFKYEVDLSRIRINCNVINLMQKWVQIKEKYQLINSSFSQEAKKDVYSVIDQLLRFAAQYEQINSICIDGKTVKITKRDIPLISAERFSLDVFREQEKSKITELYIDAAELVYLNNDFTFLRVNCFFDNGILDIGRCRARAFDGKVKINTRLDLIKKRMHDFTLNATDLNLEKITASANMQSCVSGSMDIDLNLVSSSLELDSVRGKGVIHLSEISVWETPVQRALAELLENPDFKRLSFSRVRADFDIRHRDTIRTDIAGSGEVLDFKSSGMLNMKGGINQHVDASLSDSAIKELPGFVVNSLTLDENNRRKVRCRIYGTFAEPKVELDREILKNALGNVFEQMRENLKGIFRKK